MLPVDPDTNALFRDSRHISPHYWQDLMALDPHEVCRRALVTFQSGKGFQVPFLNRPYICHVETARIFREDTPERPSSFQECLVILNYLIKAQDRPLEGKKINEKGLPGGETFFRGPHALLKEPLEKKFGKDPNGFLLAGLGLGGRETEIGNASFELLVLPRVPVEYILYVEDEEFPSQVLIHFDSSISRHLPLDVIWALINITSRRLTPKSEE